MGKNQKLFIVEGNIGAGKSTFLSIIHEQFDIQIVPEPVDEWQMVGEDNILEKFYQDPHRWAYTFQSYAFVTRVRKQQVYAQKNPYAAQLLERSVYSDRYCFAKNCFEQGFMNKLEWELYQEWFSWLVETYLPKPDGFIYLRTTPKTCHERLMKRNRSEEETVSVEYLTQLHNLHEEWLINKKCQDSRLATIPVFSIECDADFEYDEVRKKAVVAELKTFIDACIQPGKREPVVSERLSL